MASSATAEHDILDSIPRYAVVGLFHYIRDSSVAATESEFLLRVLYNILPTLNLCCISGSSQQIKTLRKLAKANYEMWFERLYLRTYLKLVGRDLTTHSLSTITLKTEGKQLQKKPNSPSLTDHSWSKTFVAFANWHLVVPLAQTAGNSKLFENIIVLNVMKLLTELIFLQPFHYLFPGQTAGYSLPFFCHTSRFSASLILQFWRFRQPNVAIGQRALGRPWYNLLNACKPVNILI